MAWHRLCAQSSVASPSTTYVPRQPAAGVLHQVVRDHFETFLAQAGDLRDGEGLSSFVEQEFRGFLRCGSFGGGFARFRCAGCGFESESSKPKLLFPIRPTNLSQDSLGLRHCASGTPVAAIGRALSCAMPCHHPME